MSPSSTAESELHEMQEHTIDCAGPDSAEDEKAEVKYSFLSTCMRIFAITTIQDKLLYGVGILASIGSGTIYPLMTLVFGNFVSVFTEFALGGLSSDEFRSKISNYALYFVYLFIAKAICTYIYMVLFSLVATNVSTALRKKYLHTILHCRISFHETNLTSGDVSLVLSTHSNTIRSGLAEKFGLSLKSTSTVVTAFVVALHSQWKLALVTATLIPAIVMIVALPGAVDEKLEKTLNAVKAEAATLAEEIFSSVRTVRSLGAEEKLSGRYESLLHKSIRVGVQRAPLKGLVAGLYMFTLYAGYALAFWYGIKLFSIKEAASAGTIITTLFAIIIAVNGFAELAGYASAFMRIHSASSEIFKVIDSSPEANEKYSSSITTTTFQDDIHFRCVSFAYPTRPSTRVLENLTLTFPAGKTTALVGASGSGKSTVAGLLLRWYDVAEGDIEMGDHSIANIPFKTLRSHIGLVQQEPCLFTGTVYENIENGLAGSEMECLPIEERKRLITEACKVSNAHEFIVNLPNGYDTPIGNRGTMLSGGQKQRLAIARAIVKDPPILVLDEATSALDVKSESIVQQALDNARQNRTTITIAHRLSTIRSANQIVVMRKGAIMEIGGHEDLLKKESGIYRKLWEAQSLSRLHTQPQALLNVSSVDGAIVPDPEKSSQLATDLRGSDVRIAKARGSLNLIKMVISSHRRYWWVFVVLCISALIGGALFPLQAFLYSKVVSVFQLTGQSLISSGNFWALMWLILAIAVGIGYLGIGWAGHLLGEVIGQNCRFDYFQSMTRQRVAFFDRLENSADNLVVRLSTDPDAISALIGDNIGVLGTVAVAMLSTVVMALAVGWKLGLVVLFGGLPFIFGAGVVREKMESSFEEKAGKIFAESVAYAGECLQAVRTVSALNMELLVEARFSQLLGEHQSQVVRSALYSMIWFALSESVDFLCMALAFWYGGRLLSFHEYTTTQFFIVFIAIVFGSQTTGQFFAHGSDISKGATSARAIYALADQSPKEEPSSNFVIPQIAEMDPALPLVDIQGVSFAYPARSTRQVLKDFSMKVFPGQSVAIVGPSGSGKSTVIQLLERFYDADFGQIAIGGIPIQDYPSDKLRQIFALVSQEPVLYQGTIAENINLGCSKPLDEQQLSQVLVQSQLTDVISSLPEGTHTVVGSRGGQLSGGQKQRVAIARAVAMGSPILLLDEATSALDSESERLIQTALSKTSQGKTAIAVAHRLSTIQHFDRILVLQEGSVVESGSHGELLAKKGRYWAMVDQQAGLPKSKP